ncbi:Uma2 family endonuclease [Streptomyces sp. NPDC012935]|uniref:Uma2 family endonuclease n=1 Tax=Streptomyces sp. NPDC012935 TaxID=3364857 RepID=UPI0036741DC5
MIKFFEGLEPPEGVRAELLRGEIVMSRNSGLVNNRNVTETVDQIPRNRWYPLQTQCVDMLDFVSAPVPDVVVTERGAGPDQGTYVPSAVVTALVEVVSETSVERDYGVKRAIYAASGVPAYLIIDPIMAHCVLFAEPKGSGEEAEYHVQRMSKFGCPVPMDCLGLEVDTTGFGTFSNVRPHRYP